MTSRECDREKQRKKEEERRKNIKSKNTIYSFVFILKIREKITFFDCRRKKNIKMFFFIKKKIFIKHFFSTDVSIRFFINAETERKNIMRMNKSSSGENSVIFIPLT